MEGKHSESCGMWHQAWMDSAGWMLYVRRWRGLLGPELAILSQALHHLPTSASNVLFRLSNPLLLPHPSLMSNSASLHAVFTLLSISFFCLLIQDLNYTPETIFIVSSFIHCPLPSHRPPLFCSLGVRERTPHPKSLFTEVATEEQRSGAPP